MGVVALALRLAADPLNVVFCTGLTVLILIGPRRAWLMNRTVAMSYMVVFLLFL
jgi:hypothetical protein